MNWSTVMKKKSMPMPRDKRRSKLPRSTVKGSLACEWCGRRTEVGKGIQWGSATDEDWEEFALSQMPFYCARSSCQQARRELGVKR